MSGRTHENGWRLPEAVIGRHVRMVALRSKGMLLKQIGNELDLDHSTVVYHLQGQCRCGLEGSAVRPPPLWAATLWALYERGPMTTMALAEQMKERRQLVLNHLNLLKKAGLVQSAGNPNKGYTWRVRTASTAPATKSPMGNRGSS